MVTQLQAISRFWSGVFRRTAAEIDGGRAGYSRPEVNPIKPTLMLSKESWWTVVTKSKVVQMNKLKTVKLKFTFI